MASSQVAEVVVELHGHLDEERCSPLMAFGTPAAYAARVAESIGDAEEARRRRSPDPARIRVEGVSVAYGRPSTSCCSVTPQGLDRHAATRHGQRLAERLGWDASAAPTVARLSGGTRQKLNVVLAGLGEPDVLLLDEPYQGLDFDSTRRFWELLWAWRDAGRAALVVSHAHDALDRVDDVVELGPAGRPVRS